MSVVNSSADEQNPRETVHGDLTPLFAVIAAGPVAAAAPSPWTWGAAVVVVVIVLIAPRARPRGRWHLSLTRQPSS
ncbi:hypothetical protein [Streptomyces sp. DT171]|uniref:hypothetical protein n=1 Tax=Streptomyces sp. DT171 TaxID=3416524 RepID=UPI003CEEF397